MYLRWMVRPHDGIDLGLWRGISPGKLVIPVAHNAGYFWPRRGLLKKRGTVRVVIGPPIQAAGREPREINAEAQDWIEEQIRRMVPQT